MRHWPFLLCGLFWAVGTLSAQEADAPPRDQVLQTMKRAATFYREQVAHHGGYVYYSSLDLSEHWGEGKASVDTIFVQPPGTPTVGMAYLHAYKATGDKFYLDAARAAAEALVNGQLESGGWTQVIHFAPAQRLGKYRKGKGGSWNASSLDDGQTQAALTMLMQMDRALKFKDASIHEAARFGLKSLLDAQFANGAFPQVWTGPSAAQPILKAKLPLYDWKTGGRVKDYWSYYTLNDDLAGTVADTLITAHQIYGDEKYRTALRKLGDFLIAAQMPAPQPAWCQQYNFNMIPIWARKFEPPAISGSESQDVIKTLIRIATYTKQDYYLEPIPAALAYLKKSQIADGQVARYYELETNKPLYMDAKYQLTYDDSAAPTHYGWKKPINITALERSYYDAKAGRIVPPKLSTKKLTQQVRDIVQHCDEQGRWVQMYEGEKLVGQPKFAQGFRYLSSEVFSRNLEIMSEYLVGRK